MSYYHPYAPPSLPPYGAAWPPYTYGAHPHNPPTFPGMDPRVASGMDQYNNPFAKTTEYTMYAEKAKADAAIEAAREVAAREAAARETVAREAAAREARGPNTYARAAHSPPRADTRSLRALSDRDRDPDGGDRPVRQRLSAQGGGGGGGRGYAHGGGGMDRILLTDNDKARTCCANGIAAIARVPRTRLMPGVGARVLKHMGHSSL